MPERQLLLAPGRQPRYAYFSMEIAVDNAMPTYSGGLGVLAGDMMRSAADLGVSIVGVTLLSRKGYFRQRIVDGRQVEEPHEWVPDAHARRVPAKVQVPLGDHSIWVGAWEHVVTGRAATSRPVPVLFLDTDLPENSEEDRRLTDHLYGGDHVHRLRQEAVLGIGGVRMLRALGVEVLKFHLNEGHAALLTLELLREHDAGFADDRRLERAAIAVQRQCVFTTHTPVAAGHDQFDYGLAEPLLKSLASATVLRTFGGAERLNLTRLALNLSGWVNGVARKHAQTSRLLFPGYEVHAITNGVHAWTWASDALRELFDARLPHWVHEPELLMHADLLPDADIVGAHAIAKRQLIERAAQVPGAQPLEAHRFTIGFARRMTSYKRPSLLFSSLERLAQLSQRHPFQVVLAGKAHPHDHEGKKHIEELHRWAHALAGKVPVVFIPGYDMALARQLVAGVDLWLNTPEPPLEASGTSGMKAAVNGVPSLSVLDGWWIEGCIEGVTGWAIGSEGVWSHEQDSEALYDKLGRVILPLFHEQPALWAQVMKGAIARNGAYFHSHRMVRRYVLEAYAG